jgi:hypothetical protein
MEWAILVPIAAVTVGPLAWVANNWIRARHGYQPELLKKEPDDRMAQGLQVENRELRKTVDRLEERLRVLERIATDPAERTAREIESLR